VKGLFIVFRRQQKSCAKYAQIIQGPQAVWLAADIQVRGRWVGGDQTPICSSVGDILKVELKRGRANQVPVCRRHGFAVSTLDFEFTSNLSSKRVFEAE